MLFLGHPVYEIAKSDRKIGLSALELGYIWIFNDLPKKLLSLEPIGSFFLRHSVYNNITKPGTAALDELRTRNLDTSYMYFLHAC